MLGWELEASIHFLDSGFNCLDAYHAALACGALEPLTQAEEVFVDSAMAAVLAVDQSSAACTAPDAALEIVRMLAIFLAGGVVGAEHGLHLQPGLGAH